MKRGRRGREWTLSRSPALSLLPQIEEEAARCGRCRRRDDGADIDGGAPGDFFAYLSAGSFELADGERRRRYVPRFPRAAVAIAAALAAVWLAFR